MRTLNIIGGIAAVAIPAAYITYKHVQWEDHPQSKKRMLTRHVSFWAIMAAGILLLHNTFFSRGMKAWRKAVNFAVASLAIVGGFELSGMFAKTLYPYVPQKAFEQWQREQKTKANPVQTPLVVRPPTPPMAVNNINSYFSPPFPPLPHLQTYTPVIPSFTKATITP